MASHSRSNNSEALEAVDAAQAIAIQACHCVASTAWYRVMLTLEVQVLRLRQACRRLPEV